MKSWTALLLIVIFLGVLGLLTYSPLGSRSGDLLPENTPSSPTAPPAKTLIFCSDPWPPYAGRQDVKDRGYIVDLVTAIYEPDGYTVSFINLPWSRCIKDTRDGRITALAGADIKEVPDFIFPEETVGTTRPTFFVRKDSSWAFKGVTSLKEIKLGVIQDYTYSEDVDEYTQRHQKSDRLLIVKGNDPLDRLIDALQNKRIEAFIENAPVVHYTLRQKGLGDQIREAGGPQAGVRLFVPFSPKLPQAKEHARRFDEKIREFRRSGKLKTILDRYQLQDWIDDAKRLKAAGH
ncbi:MAG: substrate-binding periplasmic protein [Planctomycetota bacterium]|jgi:polar amino acid transport system substrate-binding protein